MNDGARTARQCASRMRETAVATVRMPEQPGAYYVLMREQDMTARRFDLARVTYQCG
ncbi:hypothetical protein [Achromobacter xylosoxidans]|uniref:hypothetical protein n=1 Tax=Alcaligenes xylosoxydans xylosoxydans TaxID=85698 RepID=UPI0022B86471|nr:hypothetical protein [Achromobacter xylosoxidans]MCZ8392586.1 hypothetical protein [Achromobacter xylosoxidans]